MQYFLKCFVFREYQKHSRLFHDKKNLVDFKIKDISNFVQEYQEFCFCLLLPYGNNVT